MQTEGYVAAARMVADLCVRFSEDMALADTEEQQAFARGGIFVCEQVLKMICNQVFDTPQERLLKNRA
ncbi:MAG: hypothetical protein K6U74_19335 [Firmicutes bacterium]|nr:hypothetical protein [Bacillota bacterium]